jgi:hypothetical protein
MAKSIAIRMTDSERNQYRWIIRHVPRMTIVGEYKNNGNVRHASGWEYEDHNGYVRTVEGNWLDLVAAVRLTVENHGFTLCSALS